VAEHANQCINLSEESGRSTGVGEILTGGGERIESLRKKNQKVERNSGRKKKNVTVMKKSGERNNAIRCTNGPLKGEGENGGGIC